MSKHTPEPWLIVNSGLGAEHGPSYIKPEQGGLIAHIYLGDKGGTGVVGQAQRDERSANAHRICDCVNALAGVDDPVGALKKARALLRTIGDDLHHHQDPNGDLVDDVLALLGHRP